MTNGQIIYLMGLDDYLNDLQEKEESKKGPISGKTYKIQKKKK